MLLEQHQKRRSLDGKKGPEPLAPSERCMPNSFEQAIRNRASGLSRLGFFNKDGLEPRFG